MVSALFDGVSICAATWWANPKIPTTTASTQIDCWDPSLKKPGAVEIATTGQWAGKEMGLTGGAGPNFNHAKIGVTTSPGATYVILGDLNQQGTLSGPKCSSSQNGRGGLFYVIDNATLFTGVSSLIKGATPPPANRWALATAPLTQVRGEQRIRMKGRTAAVPAAPAGGRRAGLGA
jgi:hypothetical protein